MAAEIKDLNYELNIYDERNSVLKNNIAAIERKKARVLNVLNINRTRHESIVNDVKKCK